MTQLMEEKAVHLTNFTRLEKQLGANNHAWLDALRKRGIARFELAQALGGGPASQREVSEFLYTQGLPDPDLIIRTAGEMRLSNFLLWQSAYAEFYSTPTLWPDFGEADLEQALVAYQSRVRRFGARPEEEVSHRARQVNG